MARLDAVRFGGSACPDELGERLVAAGIKLLNGYGATETGSLMAQSPDEWNWLVPLPSTEPCLEFEREGGSGDDDDDNNLFHLVIKPGLPGKYFSTRPDGTYETKDLFKRHPTDHRKWKYVSRKDDTIVLVNGEKANPVPLEEAAKQHPDVQMAVVFGAQRDFLGMIVIPEPAAKEVRKDEIVSRIWPLLEAANKVVPAYARLSPDAILVKDAGTPFPMTEKLSLKRKQFIDQFQADIDAFYDRMARGGAAQEADEARKLPTSAAGLRDLVRRTVRETLQLQDGSELTDDADFFLLGMDSLQATQVRNALARELGEGEDRFPTNVVFENPSVARLAQFVVTMKQAVVADRPQDEAVVDLVKKYSQFSPASRKQATEKPAKEVVVLTGATGTLGCHILNTLLHNPNVQRVYCLVRAENASNALSRTYDALKSARLLDRLSPEQREKIVALRADLGQDHFALPQSAYDQIASTVTTVIHNAWTVNFNMGLSSFEPQCIRGTYHLLNLCLRSPYSPLPAFAFVSTIGVVLECAEKPVREQLHPLAAAGGMGYSQSKWCAERICAAASAAAGVPVRIMRIGQIVGDTEHGRWNPKEAVPLTVMAALTTGALPLRSAGSDRLSWLPVDVTARAVVELALMDRVEEGYVAPGLGIYHVSQPRTISWNDAFLPALKSAGLEFEALRGPEWVSRLKMSEKDPEKNPPMKLFRWLKTWYAGEGLSAPSAATADGDGLAETAPESAPITLDMTESRKAAPSLRNPKTVGQEEMGKYLRYWTEEAWAGLPLAAPAAKAIM